MIPAAAENAPRDPHPALGGRLAAVSLFDICQFLLLNRKTGTLTVRSDGAVAYLTFSDGQIMTATDEAFRDGEAVVLRALQWVEGTFDFAPGPVSPIQKIESSTDSILLEAARKIDEMRAGDLSTPHAEASAEASFREKQQRAASLTEAFRSAVSVGDGAWQGKSWKEEALAALAHRGTLRLLLVPGPRVLVVGLDGVREIRGIPATELGAWIDEIAPRSVVLKHPTSMPVRTETDQGQVLWSRRRSSPEGEWVAVSLARSTLPTWEELGLPDPLYPQVQSKDGLTLLLSAGAGSSHSAAWPGAAVLAAWLQRRTAARAESAWIVETLPAYDWSLLPGNIRSIAPAQLRRPGSLEESCRLTGATLVALLEVNDDLLPSALALAADGLRVVLVGAGSNPSTWARTAERRLAGRGLPLATLGELITSVWVVQSGPPPDWLPLTCRFGALRPGKEGEPAHT